MFWARNNRAKKIICAVILVVFVPVVFGDHIRAQPATANTLKISPLRTDISVDPGDSAVIGIVVTNPTDRDISVRPIRNDFMAGDEEGNPSVILDDNKFAPSHSLKKFLAPIDDFVVPASGSKSIEVGINVPSDSRPGGYFGAIRFVPTIPDSGGQVNMSISVTSLILLTVNGPAEEKLTLSNFDIYQSDKPINRFTLGSSDLSLYSRFENKGSIQLAPFGKISVKKDDKIIYDTDFNNRTPRSVILPDSSRHWKTKLNNIEGFGRYTVNSTFTYGAKNQTIEVEKTFWVIPKWFFIGLAGLLVSLCALVIFVHKRNKGLKLR